MERDPMDAVILDTAQNDKQIAKRRAAKMLRISMLALCGLLAVVIAFIYYNIAVSFVLAISIVVIVVWISWHFMADAQVMGDNIIHDQVVMWAISEQEHIIETCAAFSLNQLGVMANTAVKSARKKRNAWFVIIILLGLSTTPFWGFEPTMPSKIIASILALGIFASMIISMYKDKLLTQEQEYWWHVLSIVKHHRKTEE